jgi:hypothetical protein
MRTRVRDAAGTAGTTGAIGLAALVALALPTIGAGVEPATVDAFVCQVRFVLPRAEAACGEPSGRLRPLPVQAPGRVDALPPLEVRGGMWVPQAGRPWRRVLAADMTGEVDGLRYVVTAGTTLSIRRGRRAWELMATVESGSVRVCRRGRCDDVRTIVGRARGAFLETDRALAPDDEGPARRVAGLLLNNALFAEGSEGGALAQLPDRIERAARDMHAFWSSLRGGTYRPPARILIALGLRGGSLFDPGDRLLVLAPPDLRHGLGGVLVELAHEFGHAAQGLRLPLRPGRSRLAFEAQADCLAGVWMGHARAGGQVSAAEVADALRSIQEAGNSPLHPPGAQRLRSFLTGLNAEPGADPYVTCPFPTPR